VPGWQVSVAPTRAVPLRRGRATFVRVGLAIAIVAFALETPPALSASLTVTV
jgi:hypothetical protein